MILDEDKLYTKIVELARYKLFVVDNFSFNII
jgi:hypothetical protein